MEPALSNLVVSPEALDSIQVRLRQLVQETSAAGAMLLDRSGQIISISGDFRGREVTSLGALLAGNFASALEIARLLKEHQFKMCFQQGEREHVLTSRVGERCLLTVLFQLSTQLGLVKLLSAQAAEDLALVVEAGIGQALVAGLDTGSFRRAAEEGIDRWFREQGDERVG